MAKMDLKGLELGLRNRWYLIARTDVLGDRPVALRRFGEDLVVWRDKDGRPVVQQDRCPHRGARLSQGEVLEGEVIACRYHGIQIAANGCIAAVPAVGPNRLVGRPAVRVFPAFEHSAGIWAWFGEPAADQEPEPPSFPEELAPDGPWNGYLWTGEWKTNWLYVIENVADPMHGTYLHAGTYTLGGGSRIDSMRVSDNEDGFRIERKGQQNANFDWAEFHDTGFLWFRLDIPYPRSAGPGGPLRIIGTVCPIDVDRAQIFFAHTRQSSGFENDAWRLLYRTVLYPRHMQVLDQDRDILETLPKDARQHELLYQHDIGVTRLRRLLLAKAAGPKAHRRRA